MYQSEPFDKSQSAGKETNTAMDGRFQEQSTDGTRGPHRNFMPPVFLIDPSESTDRHTSKGQRQSTMCLFCLSYAGRSATIP